MKTTPMTVDHAPVSTRQILKALPQNLEGQFNADKTAAEKRIPLFDGLHSWCEGLETTAAKLAPIPAGDMPTNIRPIIKTFHENLQAAWTPLSEKERSAVIKCIQDWCTANTKVLQDAGKGATAS